MASCELQRDRRFGVMRDASEELVCISFGPDQHFISGHYLVNGAVESLREYLILSGLVG